MFVVTSLQNTIQQKAVQQKTLKQMILPSRTLVTALLCSSLALVGCSSKSNAKPYNFKKYSYAQLKKQKFRKHGMASYYAKRFHGRRTANGEYFNMYAMTAAHKKLKFGTHLKVTNKRNGKSVIVRINDRGPYAKGRIIDLSYGAAKKLGMLKSGVAKVKLQVVPKP